MGRELASLIVDQVLTLTSEVPQGDLEAAHPSYGYDRWRMLEGYLRDHVDEGDVGLPLLVKLLGSGSAWIVFQTLSALWRTSYSERDVTSYGLRLTHIGVQAPLIKLLDHTNVTTVLSSIGLIVSVLHGLDEQYQMSFITEGISTPLKQVLGNLSRPRSPFEIM